MDKLVHRLPLAKLWDDAGPVAAARRRDLTAADIRDLLRAGSVRFVMANIGKPLQWVPASECYQFWKAEVQSMFANPDGAFLDDYSGGYCYFALHWEPAEGPPVVLLSVAH